MRPSVRLGVTREEAGGGDGAGLAPAHVGHIGKVGIELLLVVVPQGHPPDAIGGGLSGGDDLFGEMIILGEKPRRVLAQCNHAGAGQGGQIDHQLRVEALAVGECVAEDESAFGIRIEDLDGLARHAGHDVPGFVGVAVGHVLRRGDDADQVDRQAQLAGRKHGPEDTGAAAHVVLHLVHVRGRLDRDAAGVEGEALADQHDRLGVGLPAAVVHDDELGRLATPARDREEGAHLELLHVGLFEDLGLQPLVTLAELGGLLGQIGRGADIAR